MHKVAYVGDSMYYGALLDAAQRRHPFELSKFRLADAGLDALTRDKFDLIIMRDEIASGSLELPSHFRIDDYSGIACHVIKQTRASGANVQTPIIVPYTEDCPLTPLRRYKEAGATECVDILQVNPSRIFSAAVGKHIGRAHR